MRRAVIVILGIGEQRPMRCLKALALESRLWLRDSKVDEAPRKGEVPF
jgi:hypothetical protein